jgi:hypothetical protein
MTQERCNQLLPVMTAFAEGKAIQFRRVGVFDWMDLPDNPDFGNDYQYRIKPEPEPRPILPPALLEALKAYIDNSSASVIGAAFDYKNKWSAVEAANREEV